jgi:hypothetical protein
LINSFVIGTSSSHFERQVAYLHLSRTDNRLTNMTQAARKRSAIFIRNHEVHDPLTC